MDGSAFDRLSKALVTAGSRRGLLGLLSSLPLAGLLLSPDTTAAKPARKHRRHHRQTRQQRRTPNRHHARSEACIPTGQACPSKKPRGKKGRKLSCHKCCQGSFITEASGKKICGCQPNEAACTTATSSSCCSGFCNGSTCQAAPCSPAAPCPQCQTCNASGLCEPVANGTLCDDGNPCTTGDVCTAGVCTATPITCPTGQTCQGGVCGVTCGGAFCPAATEICSGGSCQPCDVCPGAGVCAFTSVQTAIATTSLATIHVCAGTYNETATSASAIRIQRTVTVIGAGDGADPAANTILRPALTERRVMQIIGDGITTAIVSLERLRLRDGATSTSAGAGIAATDGVQVTLTDCTVTENSTNADGGGIFLNGATLSLVRSHITFNHAGIRGGGIRINSVSSNSVTVDADSRITDNDSNLADPDSGGGIFDFNGTATLASTQNVTNNTPDNCGGTVPANCSG